ncbi:MAG: sigma 54-interacting transcriptional regulator [bacterium]
MLADILNIDKYKILGKIDESNYAIIYKIETSDKKVRALKIARKKTAAYNELIVREFNILSEFKHPNIIAVHDFNTSGGKSFFTLDYAEGKPINKYFKVFSNDFIRALIQIINGLGAFHNRGFVHGDLKPEHLLYDEHNHQVVIIDFGFAGIPKQLLRIAGTFGYMAPEVIHGTTFDQRSDLYSLGIILYETLAGKKFKKTFKPVASIPQEVNNILARLVAKEPMLRPPLPELHRVISKFIKDKKSVVPEYKVSLPSTGFVEIPEIMKTLNAINSGAIIINGDSGTGKSRLLHEMKLKYSAKGYRILFHNGADQTNFLNALSHFLDIKEDIFNDKENRLQVYEDIHAALMTSAEKQKTLIIIDDIDRLSDYEIGLFRYLGYGIEQTNIIILAASVPGGSVNEIGFSSLNLRPFTCQEIEILLQKTYFEIKITSGTGLSSTMKFAKWLYKQSGGLPLFIVEIMKMLNENGLFYFIENKWQIALNKLQMTTVPEKIDELLQKRIEPLKESELNTLELLALIEHPITPMIITNLIPKKGNIAIERLKNMGLIMEDMKDNERVLSIPHQILAKTVARQIKRSKAGQLRAKLIQILENAWTRHLDYLPILARLCDVNGDAAKAYKYAKLAADSAQKIYDYDSALLFHEISLRYAREIAKPDIPMLLIKTGDLNQLIGNNKLAVKYYQQALKYKIKKLKFKIYAGLGRVYTAMGEHDQASEHLRKSLTCISQRESIDHIQAANRLAYALIMSDKITEASKILSDSLKSAKKNKNHEIMAETQYYDIVAEWSKKNTNKAIQKAKELLEFSQKYTLTKSTAHTANILSMLYQEKNELDRVQQYLAIAIDNFKKRKISSALLNAMANQASINYFHGKFNEAEKICADILSKAQQTNNRSIAVSALTTLASINKYHADFYQALTYAEQTLKIDPINELAISDIAEILCFQGNTDKAVSFLNIKYPDKTAARYDFALARCNAVQGNTAEAEKLLKQGLHAIKDKKTDVYDQRYGYAAAMQVYYSIRQYNKSLAAAKQLLAITNPQNRQYILAQAYVKLNDYACGNSSKLDITSVFDRLKSIHCIYDYAHIRRLEIEALEKKGTEPENIVQLLEHLNEIMGIFRSADAKTEIVQLEKIQMNMIPWILKAYSERAIAHKYFNTFSRLAELISENLGDEAFIEEILDLIVHTAHAERGALFLNTIDGMRFAAGRNIDQTTIKDAGELSKTVIAKMNKNKIIYTQDALSDPDFNIKKSVVINKIRAILCLPLAVAQNVVGALYLDSRVNTETFGAQDIDFLSAVSRILASVIERSIVFRETVEENILLKTKMIKEIGTGYLIGNSKTMKRVYDLVHSVAQTNSPVLLLGETGTGKGMLARLIHTKSKRHAMKFRTINCGTIPETLLESELFGYKKGAFTDAASDKIGLLEEAHYGTVFLDEITNTSASFQAKILEAIEEKVVRRVGETQTRKIDVRFLFATNKDLEIEVEENRFRKDLYYRVNVFTIEVPPLRERTSDIPMLAQFFCDRYSKELGKNIHGFAPDALRVLTEYFWPGNVRELQNVIERTIVLAKGGYIRRQDIGLGKTKNPALPLSQIKKEAIIEALTAVDGNVQKAARVLGINRKTIQRYIKKFNLSKARLDSG